MAGDPNKAYGMEDMPGYPNHREEGPSAMTSAITEALHQLAETSVRLDLLPIETIEAICGLVNDSVVGHQIITIWRASNERTRELEAEIKVCRENIQGMVKSSGATVKAAGFKAGFYKGSVYADLKRLKLDVEEDPTLARFLKRKADSCRITRVKS